MSIKPYRELISEDDDADELIRQWVADAPHRCEFLPVTREDGRRALEALQVTTRSPLGALAFRTGGLLIDDGWLRVLGGGCDRLRALDDWNKRPGGETRCEDGLLVADDAIGGFFAWFSSPRSIHYLAPDTLKWEDLGLGYVDWLQAMLTARLDGFYEDIRWPRWREVVAALHGDRMLHIHPPLFADGPPIGERSRRDVPVDEMWRLTLKFARKLNGGPPEPRA